MISDLQAHYGLKWNPFSLDVPLEGMLATAAVEHFTWRVEQLSHEGGFALLTGEPGTGKSVTLRLVGKRTMWNPALAWRTRRMTRGMDKEPTPL